MTTGKPQHRTARHSALDLSAQSVALVFSLLSGIVVSRVLGPEGRGVFILAIAVLSGFLAELAGFGLYSGAQVFAARIRAGRRPGGRALSELHTLMVLVCMVGSVLCAAAVWLAWPWLAASPLRGLGKTEAMVVLGTLPAAAYLPAWHGFLAGLGELRRRAVAELLFGVTQAIVVILLALLLWAARMEEGVAILVLAYCAVQMLAAALMLRELRRFRIGWRWPRARLVSRVLGYSGVVWAGNLANALQRQADLLIVNIVLTPAAVGIYSLASGLASRSAIVAQALQRSLVARVSAGGPRESARLCAAGMRQMLLIGVLLVGAGVLAAPLVPMLYGEEFRAAAPLLAIVLAGWAFLGMSRMLALFFSAHLLRPGLPLLVNWVAFPVQVLALVILVPAYGTRGAAWSFVLSAAVQCAIFAVLFLRRSSGLGAADIFLPQRADLTRWRAFLPGGDTTSRASKRTDRE